MKKTRAGQPFIGQPERLKKATHDQYERIDDQSEHAPVTSVFHARQTEGQYGGVTSEAAQVSPEPVGIGLHTLEDRILELPFHSQLMLLRTIAPRILENLSPNDREAFFLGLGEELERRVGGQGSLPFH